MLLHSNKSVSEKRAYGNSGNFFKEEILLKLAVQCWYTSIWSLTHCFVWYKQPANKSATLHPEACAQTSGGLVFFSPASTTGYLKQFYSASEQIPTGLHFISCCL